MGTNPSDLHHEQSESVYKIDMLTIGHEILPEELIFEILVRLPVKPLLRFKCVSKPWLSMISSPRFVRSHFSISSDADHHYLNSQLLISEESVTCAFVRQISLHSALYQEPSVLVSDAEYPNLEACKNISILGIINGLVCLQVERFNVFALWNPALRISKLLPVRLSQPGSGFVMYGFGYDESRDDYKVISIDLFNGMIFSLLTDSWRIIEGYAFRRCEGRFREGYNGKYANGKIYWLVYPGLSDLELGIKIASLDMVSEKFEELQLPECYEADSSEDGPALGVSNGRLFLLYNHPNKTDLWVMDKYGVQESWSKVVSIPHGELRPASWKFQIVCILTNGDIVLSDGEDFIVYHSKHKEQRDIELVSERVVCILRNEKIVVSDGWDLIVYHSKHKEFKLISKSRGRGRTPYRYHVYVESLVSPNGFGISPFFTIPW